MSDLESVLVAATVTSSGSFVFRSGQVRQLAILMVTVANAPTGTAPVLTFTITEVNPNDETTTSGNTASITFNAAANKTLTLDLSNTSTALVSWSVTGTTPSFTGVTATIGRVPKTIIMGKRDDGAYGNAEFDNNNQFKVVSSLVTSVAKTLEIAYDATVNVAGAFAGTGIWFKGTYYTVPSSYRFVVSLFTGFSSNANSILRAAKLVQLGTYNTGTASFGATNSYASPTFASTLEAEVTTATGNTGTDHDINLVVTYTNQDGTASRSATVTVLKNSPVGAKFIATLQSGDYGVRAVTGVSVASGGALTGAVAFNGLVVFISDEIGVANESEFVTPSYGSMIVAAGEQLALDYASNAAATAERAIKVVGNIEPT